MADRILDLIKAANPVLPAAPAPDVSSYSSDQLADMRTGRVMDMLLKGMLGMAGGAAGYRALKGMADLAGPTVLPGRSKKTLPRRSVVELPYVPKMAFDLSSLKDSFNQFGENHPNLTLGAALGVPLAATTGILAYDHHKDRQSQRQFNQNLDDYERNHPEEAYAGLPSHYIGNNPRIWSALEDIEYGDHDQDGYLAKIDALKQNVKNPDWLAGKTAAQKQALGRSTGQVRLSDAEQRAALARLRSGTQPGAGAGVDNGQGQTQYYSSPEVAAQVQKNLTKSRGAVAAFQAQKANQAAAKEQGWANASTNFAPTNDSFGLPIPGRTPRAAKPAPPPPTALAGSPKTLPPLPNAANMAAKAPVGPPAPNLGAGNNFNFAPVPPTPLAKPSIGSNNLYANPLFKAGNAPGGANLAQMPQLPKPITHPAVNGPMMGGMPGNPAMGAGPMAANIGGMKSAPNPAGVMSGAGAPAGGVTRTPTPTPAAPATQPGAAKNARVGGGGVKFVEPTHSPLAKFSNELEPSAAGSALTSMLGLRQGSGPIADWLNPKDATSVFGMPWVAGAALPALAGGAAAGYAPMDYLMKKLRKRDIAAQVTDAKKRYEHAIRQQVLAKQGAEDDADDTNKKEISKEDAMWNKVSPGRRNFQRAVLDKTIPISDYFMYRPSSEGLLKNLTRTAVRSGIPAAAVGLGAGALSGNPHLGALAGTSLFGALAGGPVLTPRRHGLTTLPVSLTTRNALYTDGAQNELRQLKKLYAGQPERLNRLLRNRPDYTPKAASEQPAPNLDSIFDQIEKAASASAIPLGLMSMLFSGTALGTGIHSYNQASKGRSRKILEDALKQRNREIYTAGPRPMTLVPTPIDPHQPDDSLDTEGEDDDLLYG